MHFQAWQNNIVKIVTILFQNNICQTSFQTIRRVVSTSGKVIVLFQFFFFLNIYDEYYIHCRFQFELEMVIK